MARGIGHGRHYIGAVDHFATMGTMGEDDAPGVHGGSKDGAFQVLSRTPGAVILKKSKK